MNNTQKLIVFLIFIIFIYLFVNSFYESPKSSSGNILDHNELKKIIDDESRSLIIDETEESDILESTDSLESDSSKSTVRPTMNNLDSPIENFTANGIDNPVIDQGTWENAYALMNPPLTAGGKDTMSQRLIVYQVSDKEFLTLVTEIKGLIANIIVSYAKTCQDMHGSEVKLHDGKRALTLACVTNPYELQEKIIDQVYEMIYQFVKSRFDIHMNPYMVYHDLNMQLNLMEGIIYPLQFSGLYTVHGVQYTNEDWIRNKVQDNLDVPSVLMSIFARRGIEIQVDTDQQIH